MKISCEQKMKTSIILAIFSSSLLITPIKGQNCTLNDVQRTNGVCKDVVECGFAREQLKAGIKPTVCSGRVVCCPVEPTLSARKCEEYKEYLKLPLLSWGPPGDEIICAVPPKGFISGGRPAEPYEYPHVVALGWGNDVANLGYYCTGTLVSEQFVLTAGHCLTSSRGKPSFVMMGDITLKEQTQQERKIVKIEEYVMHPEYKPPLIYNDIALLKLSESLKIDRYLLPACLPQSSIGVKSTDDPLEAVGFGLLGPGEPQTNTLQSVNLTAFSTSGCAEYYDNVPEKATRFPSGLSKSQMCAGDRTESGKDTCNGDSGGPLSINVGHRCVFHIMGVTSFGARLCGYGTPAVFTKVFTYNNWIESVIWPDGM